jgi:hypothetical protein
VARDGSAAAFIQFDKRHRGYANAISATAPEKCLPENIDSKAGIGARQFFVKRTHQNDAPKALNGT